MRIERWQGRASVEGSGQSVGSGGEFYQVGVGGADQGVGGGRRDGGDSGARGSGAVDGAFEAAASIVGGIGGGCFAI